MRRTDAPVIVLLAAGASRRLGEPKALVRLREREPATPLALLLEATAGLGCERLLIAGAHAEAIRAALPAGSSARLVEHAAWERGRTGSVRAAARAAPGCDLLLTPVDVPLVPRGVFAALLASWAAAGAPRGGWLGPFVEETDGSRRFGHPVLLGRALLAHLRPEDDDAPLASLREKAEPLLATAVTARAVLDDLDTPEDLRRLRVRLTDA